MIGWNSPTFVTAHFFSSEIRSDNRAISYKNSIKTNLLSAPPSSEPNFLLLCFSEFFLKYLPLTAPETLPLWQLYFFAKVSELGLGIKKHH
jgi:hypothetical protein